MSSKALRLSALVLLSTLGLPAPGHDGWAQEVGAARLPDIPKAWDDGAVASLEVPLIEPNFSPSHVLAEYYYRIPVRPIYKGYTVYHPDFEPAGYWEHLKRQAPEEVWPARRPETEAEWIRAGEIVFHAPLRYDAIVSVEDVRDREWYKKARLGGIPLASDGSLPFVRYFVVPAKDKKAEEVVLGNLSCAMCHSRVMPDGSAIMGAQGNFPFDRAVADRYRTNLPVEVVRRFHRASFGVPWLRPDPLAGLDQRPAVGIAEELEAIPPGVLARHRSGAAYPQSIPDLIGLKGRAYLDKTGLVRQRSIADLMRYMALNQEVDDLARFGTFIPAADDFQTRPQAETQARYSDEQLYALATYLYALQPPRNPNGSDPLAARGERVFRREDCRRCHAGTLFTNNKLMPVVDFAVPPEHRMTYAIMDEAIDTAPELTLKTRRGTGYYKVPSLRGVWYRSMFGHDGSCATLEDWFDPHRLDANYRPTGFRGYKVESRAVPGHEYGLDLDSEDKRALIAYLKTL
jgi:hypothetical protein